MPRIALNGLGRIGKLVLRNLIENAVKFTDRGYVQLEAKRSGEMLCFDVSDSGIGIREEDEIPDLQSSDVDQGRSLLRRWIGAVVWGGVVHRSVDRFAPVSCAAPRCLAPPRPAVSAGATRGGRTH